MKARISRLILCSAFIVVKVLLAGCTTVKSSVERFHTLPASGDERKVAVVPTKAQTSSLEFQAYASLVKSRFRTHGYIVVDELEDADYAAFINYGIGGGQASTAISSNPSYGLVMGGPTGLTPQFGYQGMRTTSKTSVTYSRHFTLVMFDLNTWNGTEAETVFQGVVRSRGKSDTFSEVRIPRKPVSHST